MCVCITKTEKAESEAQNDVGKACLFFEDFAKLFSIDGSRPVWPGEGNGLGAGAVVPIDREDLSMGMSPGNESMWLSLSSDREARKAGAPSTFEAQLKPWWGPPSELTYRNNEIALGMGYDILRLQGMKSSLSIDGEEFEGTAYFQKVTVQAPSGAQIAVIVPPGVVPGQLIQVPMPMVQQPAAVPPGEWALHLTDVTEGAAALQLPAVPPVVIPLTVAAPPPEEEEEY